ncbi:MAG: hypothetical protein JW809_04315 [Pirellulales bacterium]|nr:hypothetical protein [Pirellulales bacterium]
MATKPTGLTGVFLAVFLTGAALAGTTASRPDSVSAAANAQQPALEADWRRQLPLRYPSRVPDNLANPWWDVDLGRVMPIERVDVFNLDDVPPGEGILGMTANLSADGREWTEVSKHFGRQFHGPSDPIGLPCFGTKARYVRILLPWGGHFEKGRIDVLAAGGDQPLPTKPGLAASRREPIASPALEVIRRGRLLADDLAGRGVDVARRVRALDEVAAAWKTLPNDAPSDARERLYLDAQRIVRQLALANPLVDFDRILFVKRAPNLLLCHCDEYLSWWSRPGGELCVLEDFRSDAPRVRSLTAGLLPPGDVIRPDLSYDGAKALFAYCRHYPDLAANPNKVDKESIPEDAFYHIYEINLDGTGLRRLTHGRYDDFDARYLPSGEIVFLSTRRGRFVQCGLASAEATRRETLPDAFVRCGGSAYRPVSIHTLHVMDADGGALRAISPFESFEWNPSVTDDGRIVYARWDYVDRHAMWHMSLWSTLPNGMAAQIVFGNFTQGPYSLFEARDVPGTRKYVFTASAHHSHAGGSLVLADVGRGVDGAEAMTRLTPEVPFPEWEGWAGTSYFANPYPLDERHYLVGWSHERIWKHAFEPDGRPLPGPTNSLGLYLYDAFGNLTLLHRDPAISCMCPLPVRPRPRPAVIASDVPWREGPHEGAMLLQDVYEGDLAELPRGTIRALRVVGMPPKTDPVMNAPSIGLTDDDPGKFVVGTVPVESDGSAYFRVPAGVPLFLQALDAEGRAVQTMRSATYVQPEQTYTCIGCHEPRQTAPPNRLALASLRAASDPVPEPEGSWPLAFAELVQPVLDRQCASCHNPKADGAGAAVDLTPERAYETLVDFGGPRSLRKHVQTRYEARRSVAGAGGSLASPLLPLLDAGHYDVQLSPDERRRLIVWMDTYAQRDGSFDADQAERLRQLRRQWNAARKP